MRYLASRTRRMAVDISTQQTRKRREQPDKIRVVTTNSGELLVNLMWLPLVFWPGGAVGGDRRGVAAGGGEGTPDGVAWLANPCGMRR